jgi:hypothetical protein
MLPGCIGDDITDSYDIESAVYAMDELESGARIALETWNR